MSCRWYTIGRHAVHVRLFVPVYVSFFADRCVSPPPFPHSPFPCSAGELSPEQLEAIMTVVANPRAYKIPDWFLNRQKDVRDGSFSQITSSALDTKMRDDFERLKKIRNHRGLRAYWGLRVRGQHTKTTGRRGKTVGVARKS